MNINQHNYEEFFLLYVDNELPATDKLAVEQFVQEHPDLGYELEMLKQSLLTDESPGFGDKASLYRNESAEISLANCEEHFLLYVDNELDAAGKAKVETFVLQHPSLQESFTLLKQAKLPVEAIVFADKASLYREEQKRRPVFYMNWQRVAIAAVFLGAIAGAWLFIPGKKNQPAFTAGVETKSSVVPETAQPVTDADQNNTITAQPADQTEDNGPVTAQVTKSNAVNDVPVQETRTDYTNTATVTESAVEAFPKARGITVSGNSRNNEIAAAHTQTITEEHALIKEPNIIKTISNNDEQAAAQTNVQHAVYKELDTDDESKSLLLGSLEINKDKIRGLLRKAGNLFRSKAKNEEDNKTEDTRSAGNTRSLK